ncbi:MAG: molybdopterin molybdotransferase MoeA [Gammaproteobacteria bacterium]|nr:molybdopterin molybdotransferase MoeA [Gammaproteobacteria bacterium]MDD9959778.1 molybdopterin molybdotransferase MoeA [Gammaproteobacteria bacterium]
MALTPVKQAFETLLGSLTSIDESETVAIMDCTGRVLAQNLVSTVNVPPLTNSAMDGYAVRSEDLGTQPVTLKISQRIAAGEVGNPISTGQAARIFTGAPIPEGADAVVMQENCEAENGSVKILQNVESGENLRQAGEDIKAGATLLHAGHRLRPQDIGLAASTGTTELTVKRKLRVAVLTTGDELVPPGNELKPGQIYNSNYYSLAALLHELDCEVEELGVVVDDFEETKKVLLHAAAKVDCVISTGGVSVGEEDHVKAAVEANGHLDLWKLAIKPGKPFASGKIGSTQFFGLPGNPVSAFVTFLLLVKPCLLKMLGSEASQPRGFPVVADFKAQESGDRQEYIRASLHRIGAEVRVKPYENQSSGVGASLSGAQGLAIIPPYTAVAQGDVLEFIPFTELLG